MLIKRSSYLPKLFTSGATMREPKKPPRGYMDTVRDHSRVNTPSVTVLLRLSDTLV